MIPQNVSKNAPIFVTWPPPKEAEDSGLPPRDTTPVEGDAESSDDRGGETEAEQLFFTTVIGLA